MIRLAFIAAGLAALVPAALAQTATSVVTANKAALREPAKSGFVNAVQVYPFSEGALFRLFAAPERVSDIALQPGETLISAAAGDTVRWTVGDTTSGSGETKRTHLLVKPFAPGLSTNLVITTDRRVYHVQLTSTASTAMTGMRWTYPQDKLLALARHRTEAEAARPVSVGVEIAQLNFDYRITGDKPAWRPLRAFDDGRQTWIEFPAAISTGEAPPLFVLGEKGEAELVNYRIAGRFYIVDRLFGAAELRLGGKKQKIVRVMRRGATGAGWEQGR
jgi:type IV secretion system protein VirB9